MVPWNLKKKKKKSECKMCLIPEESCLQLLSIAPLAIGQRAYVMVCCPSVRPCIRPCMRVLTFSLNIFCETTYRILMKFLSEMFLPWLYSEFLKKI